jgi:LysM repeat protein
MRFSVCLCLALALGATGTRLARAAADEPRIHTVYSGQRLGSIAKRYGVSVDAICNANDMRRSDRIKPGQKLVIPSRSDKDGSRTRAQYSKKLDPSREKSGRETRSTGPERAKASEAPGPITHTVEAGQRLESIAKRYAVTIDQLCQANNLDRKEKLRVGQLLTIPKPGEKLQRAAWEIGPSKRKGYVELVSYNARWQGQVIDKKGRLRDEAAQSISNLLGATGKRPRVDPRLIRLLAQVSDRFGGRPIRVVSGFRTESYYDDSRHKVSRAVDFSIPGVPNEALRDYLRTLRDVGVGYYPNSSFVHLDVRDGAAYWVDYAGPGEPPRDSRHAEDVSDKNLDRELSELLRKTSMPLGGGTASASAAASPADGSPEDRGADAEPASRTRPAEATR